MSWLFGGSNPPPPSGGDDGDDDRYNDDEDYDEADHTKVISDFDASALVEGAKALKQIDASQNAKDVLRLAIEQEKRKKSEAEMRTHQMARENMQYRQQMMQQQHELEAKRNEQQQEMWKEKMEREAQQKAQLEKELMQQKSRQQDEWLEKQRRLNEENLSRQKKVEEEIEMKRRETMEYQAKLDRETNAIRVKAETEGKMKIERENEDIHLRRNKQELEEGRKTKLELRKEELLAYTNLMSGVRDLVTDKEKLWIMGTGLVGITAGITATRRGIHVVAKQIETRWGKPSLVRETSRRSLKDFQPNKSWLFNKQQRYTSRALKERISAMNEKLSRPLSESESAESKAENNFNGIIISPDINNKIKFITRCTQNTKKNQAPYRHLLIYGPPGTGKTLFARMLAQQSGLDYAVMTGADFIQLGSSAVTELHKIFDWAETSKKGTILFIDEADAFLRKGRESDKMSENMRNALSAFLYRTGTETKHFMIVMATNVPESLDKAVLDRIDDMIEFGLPGDAEREAMLRHYFDVYITQKAQHANIQSGIIQGRAIEIAGFDTDDYIWDRLTAKTKGFSGRQIAKYMIQVQAAMYGGMQNQLTPFLMEQILETFLKTKAFEVEEEIKHEKDSLKDSYL